MRSERLIDLMRLKQAMHLHPKEGESPTRHLIALSERVCDDPEQVQECLAQIGLEMNQDGMELCCEGLVMNAIRDEARSLAGAELLLKATKRELAKKAAVLAEADGLPPEGTPIH